MGSCFNFSILDAMLAQEFSYLSTRIPLEASYMVGASPVLASSYFKVQ